MTAPIRPGDHGWHLHQPAAVTSPARHLHVKKLRRSFRSLLWMVMSDSAPLSQSWVCASQRLQASLLCRVRLVVQTMDKAFAASPSKFMRTWASALILAGYLVHKFTLVHPFLVADNRWAGSM